MAIGAVFCDAIRFGHPVDPGPSHDEGCAREGEGALDAELQEQVVEGSRVKVMPSTSVLEVETE